MSEMTYEKCYVCNGTREVKRLKCGMFVMVECPACKLLGVVPTGMTVGQMEVAARVLLWMQAEAAAGDSKAPVPSSWTELLQLLRSKAQSKPLDSAVPATVQSPNPSQLILHATSVEYLCAALFGAIAKLSLSDRIATDERLRLVLSRASSAAIAAKTSPLHAIEIVLTELLATWSTGPPAPTQDCPTCG